MENTNSSTQRENNHIYLDPKYLSGAPNEKNIKIISKYDCLGLKEEIIHGAPSCFIITGYRGVGKTSFIQNLKNEIEGEYSKNDTLKDEKILFVSCNFVNGDKKENILRKLVRQLVSSSSEKLKHELKKNRNLDNELSSLFKRTFYSLEDNQIKTTTNTFNWDRSIGFGILLLIFLLVPILYFFDFLKGMLISLLSNVKADPNSYGTYGSYGSYTTALISLFSLIFSFLTFKISKSFTKNTIDKTEIKTLYDEEIAEVRLTECIDKLTKIGVKIVFILDELDKFEKEDELDTFLGELKPILINGKATFLLVTGQNLSTRLEKTSMIDDAILPSIVQDTYRITLPEDKEFEDFFLEIAQNKNLNKSVYKDYLNYLILKSKRIPRKFINILRQEAEWEYVNNLPKPYIIIPQEKMKIFERDSKILNCINGVIDKKVDKKNTPLSDFLVSQLFIFTEKLKLMGAASFQLEDIQIDEDLKTKFPKYYIDRLSESIEPLVEAMTKRRILNYEDTSTSYSFAEILDEGDTLSLTIKQFLKEAKGFEKLIREIHKEIYNYDESAFFNIVKDLLILGIIDDYKVGVIENILGLRNKFLVSKDNYYIEEITSVERDLRTLSAAMMTGYTYYVIKEYLDQKRFTIELGKSFEFDEVDIFVRDNNITSNYKEIIIDIKVGEFSEQRVGNMVFKLEKRLKKLLVHTATPTKFVLIYFTSSPNSEVKTLVEDSLFNLGIQSDVSLHIIVASMYRDLDKSLKEHLRSALK